MAYQFADGFDNYGTSFSLAAGYPYDSVNGTNTVVTSDSRFSPPGSTPGGCLTSTVGSWVRKNLSGSPQTIIAGFGFKIVSLPPTNPCDIIELWDTGTYQLGLAVNANGALQFYRGQVDLGGVAIGTLTANGTIVAGTWYGVVISVTIGTGSLGSVNLFLNGSSTPLISSTGLNTSASGNSFATQISLGSVSVESQGTQKYDDFYCFDSTGGFLNSPLGSDARIITKLPSGAGNYTNWTPTGLATNWQNAAQTPPLTTDYNANNVASTKDSYAMQSASLTASPFFVMVRGSMERDDAGPHTPSLFVRSTGIDSGGVVTPALTSGYLFYDAIFQNDPNTNALWTGTNADAAQVGVIEG